MAEDKVVGSFWVKLGLDTTGIAGGVAMIPIALNQSLQLFQQFESMARQAYDNTVGAAIEYKETLEDLHNTLGISTDDAQRYRAAAIATGTRIEALSQSMRQFSQRLGESGTAGDTFRARLEAMGIKVKDTNGDFRSGTVVFNEAILALNNIPAGAERAAAANALLGRNWYAMGEYIEKATIAQKTFSSTQPGVSEADIQRIDRFSIKMAQWSENVNNMKVSAGNAIIAYMDLVEKSYYDAAMRDQNSPYSQAILGGRTTEDLFPTAYKSQTGTAGVEKVIDKYAGLEGQAYDLAVALQKVNDAQAAFDLAKTGHDQEAFDTAQANLHAAKSAYDTLKASIDATAASSANLTKSLPSDWKTITGESMIDAGLLGSEGSAMRAYMEQQLAAGVGKDQALQNWTNLGTGLQTTSGKNATGTKTGAKSGTTASGERTATTPGTSDATASMKTEFGKELASLADYITKFESGLYGKAYPKWEQLEKTHWTVPAELARIAYQSILDNAAETINWIGANPIIQKSAVLTKDGYDIDISALPTVTAPTLAAADFSGVTFLSGVNSRQQNQQQQAGDTTTATPSVTIIIENQAGVTSKFTTAQSQGLAANISLNSGTPS